MTGESFFIRMIRHAGENRRQSSCAGVSVFTHSTWFFMNAGYEVVRAIGAYQQCRRRIR